MSLLTPLSVFGIDVYIQGPTRAYHNQRSIALRHH